MSASPMPPNARKAEALVKSAKVLIVDDEHYTRKVIRTLLLSIGCTKVHEATTAPMVSRPYARSIPAYRPARLGNAPASTALRSSARCAHPARFPLPNVPIIMLTGHGERSRVLEAVRLGVHEFLLIQPVSSSALQARIPSRCSPSRAPWSGVATITGRSRASSRAHKPEAESYRLRSDEMVDRPPAFTIFV